MRLPFIVILTILMVILPLGVFADDLSTGRDMLAGQTCSADSNDYDENSIVIFYSYTCPHCHNELDFFEEEVINVYPDLKIHTFEVTRPENKKNMELYESFATKYSSSTEGVPRTFINGKVFIGFDEGDGELVYNEAYKANIGYRNQIVNEIEEIAKRNGFSKTDVWSDGPLGLGNGVYYFIILLLYLPTFFIFRGWISRDAQNKRYWVSGLVAVFIISFFLFMLSIPDSIISSFASSLPFGLFVSIIALADGFNPCAFTVLFILLSLLTYTKAKKTMFHLGNTFIITSAVMYFIFIMLMVLLGSVFIAKYGEMILKILGILILVAGTINLKDFIFFKKGVSLTLSNEETSKITHKARKIVQKLNEGNTGKAFWIAIGSTIILAIGVNIVELGCSAILPAVYMSGLIGKYGTAIGMGHILWTALYSLIYIIPLYAILFNFIFTFRSDRINENQGRMLKLVAGLFMFIFGILMLLKPTMLMG